MSKKNSVFAGIFPVYILLNHYMPTYELQDLKPFFLLITFLIINVQINYELISKKKKDNKIKNYFVLGLEKPQLSLVSLD